MNLELAFICFCFVAVLLAVITIGSNEIVYVINRSLKRKPGETADYLLFSVKGGAMTALLVLAVSPAFALIPLL